jgi:glycosyltransferase involved in cell wall biosynthesis
MPKVINKNPTVQLHVAGRNAPQGITKLLSHPSVVYHGEVENAQDFMRNYSILVVPLLTGSGIRVKILEGMAMGMCVITTPTGAAGLPAERGRHLLAEDDPEQFAERLLEHMEDRTRRSNIGKAALKLIQEKFDTFTIASRLAAFYKKMS